jgi:hypothetical protein
MNKAAAIPVGIVGCLWLRVSKARGAGGPTLGCCVDPSAVKWMLFCAVIGGISIYSGHCGLSEGTLKTLT